jgi:nucleotide-binding universal stress UspA family protein
MIDFINSSHFRLVVVCLAAMVADRGHSTIRAIDHWPFGLPADLGTFRGKPLRRVRTGPDARACTLPDALHMIVAGIDGSHESLDAARWALAEARLHDTGLRVVHVWGLPYMAGSTGFAPAPEPLIYEAVKQGAESVLAAATTALRGEWTGVEVEPDLVEGVSVARALVETSAGAELLVVGSRGHGGFASLLLGSVSQEVAAHARCPVVIVPPGTLRARGAVTRATGRKPVPVNWDFVG